MKHIKFICLLLVAVLGMTLFAACNNNDPGGDDLPPPANEQPRDTAKDIGSLLYESSEKHAYARQFAIDYFDGGYSIITTYDDKSAVTDRMLTIPKDAAVPTGVPADIMQLQMPLTNVLVGSTVIMAFVASLGALDNIGSIGLNSSQTWYIDDIQEQFPSASPAYVGAYNAPPNYENLVAREPQFTMWSEMLSSRPDVMDKLDELEIKYMLDESTYESHPLGRVEWLKVYGLLLDKTEKAKELIAEQIEIAEAAEAKITALNMKELDKKSAVNLYITSAGIYYVRSEVDYITEMLRMAGGVPITQRGSTGNNFTTGAEGFLALAVNADFLFYNFNTGGSYRTLDALEAGRPTLGENMQYLKAYEDGNIWSNEPILYQAMDKLGSMIAEMYEIMYNPDVDEASLEYYFRLK